MALQTIYELKYISEKNQRHIVAQLHASCCFTSASQPMPCFIANALLHGFMPVGSRHLASLRLHSQCPASRLHAGWFASFCFTSASQPMPCFIANALRHISHRQGIHLKSVIYTGLFIKLNRTLLLVIIN
jgi:hypothetical protein